MFTVVKFLLMDVTSTSSIRHFSDDGPQAKSTLLCRVNNVNRPELCVHTLGET